MRIILRRRSQFLMSLLAAAFLVGCSGSDEKQGSGVPPSLERYVKRVEPGKMLSFPPIPATRRPQGPEASNLFANPGFEDGQSQWSVIGDATACTSTDALASEGRSSLQAAPAAGDVYVYQTPNLKPRTLYSLKALVFAPDAGVATPEVRGGKGGGVVSGAPVSGPMSAWSPVSLSFVTGVQTEKIAVGLRVGGNTPFVLLDQTALAAQPAQNLLTNGSMEAASTDEHMAEWYFNGTEVTPVPEGFNSEKALELPMLPDAVSCIVGLINAADSMYGKTVWVSAMTKAVPEGNTPAPEVTIELRSAGSAGREPIATAKCQPTGDWVETAFLATIPAPGPEGTAAPPFELLQFKRPVGVGGQVFIDDVMVLVAPDGKIDGALSANPVSQ